MLSLLASRRSLLRHNVVASGQEKSANLLGSPEARLLHDHRTEVLPRCLEEDADRTSREALPREGDRFCTHCGPKRRRLRPLSLRCSASHGFRDAILSFTLDEYPAGCIRRRARQPPRSRQATAPVPKATSLAAGKPEAPVRPDNTSDAAPACDG
jgi:hypothetical protein